MGSRRPAPARQLPPGVQPLRPGRRRRPAAYRTPGPQRLHVNVSTEAVAAIDRVALIVSDLDRAEDDYVRTLGADVERRDDIEPSATRVLRIPHGRGRRSLLRLGSQRIELLEFTDSAG